ncbi:hypothetical protein E2C01_044251 [Portunus trituberculatus]|uniref:Uncharacterized protein n=1 Tax=Portunus trituberculatus TaxID=210409 RepID=A0A5B7FZG7_PORTR|nr:hypothetical protein [Portunus trituberculatus]
MSLCAERITEVIVSGMEVYIPCSFSHPKPSKSWFNTACSHAIHVGEVTYKRETKMEQILRFIKNGSVSQPYLTIAPPVVMSKQSSTPN